MRVYKLRAPSTPEVEAKYKEAAIVLQNLIAGVDPNVAMQNMRDRIAAKPVAIARIERAFASMVTLPLNDAVVRAYPVALNAVRAAVSAQDANDIAAKFEQSANKAEADAKAAQAAAGNAQLVQARTMATGALNADKAKLVVELAALTQAQSTLVSLASAGDAEAVKADAECNEAKRQLDASNVAIEQMLQNVQAATSAADLNTVAVLSLVTSATASARKAIQTASTAVAAFAQKQNAATKSLNDARKKAQAEISQALNIAKEATKSVFGAFQQFSYANAVSNLSLKNDVDTFKKQAEAVLIDARQVEASIVEILSADVPTEADEKALEQLVDAARTSSGRIKTAVDAVMVESESIKARVDADRKAKEAAAAKQAEENAADARLVFKAFKPKPTEETDVWNSFVRGDNDPTDYPEEFSDEYDSFIIGTAPVDLARLQAAAYAYGAADKTTQLHRKLLAFAQ